MGVYNTKEWLMNHWDEPLEWMSKIDGISEREAISFYRYLQKHGMFAPSKRTRPTFEGLVQKKAWKEMERLFLKYKQLWNGPDIGIYLFPVKSNFSLFGDGPNKSGLALGDKMFLFLSPDIDKEQWEAVFVHEYHHCARMEKLEKREEEYRLLDSILFEGLAEFAVKEYVGEKWNASWCKQYTSADIKKWWRSYVQDHLMLSKQNPVHDRILYGKGMLPSMLGYATGFSIVEECAKKWKKGTKEMLALPAETFLKEWNQ